MPTDANNVTFDEAVKVFDNVDPNDLPILPDYEDYYYDEEYDQSIRVLRKIPFIPSTEFHNNPKLSSGITSTNNDIPASYFLKFSTTSKPVVSFIHFEY